MTKQSEVADNPNYLAVLDHGFVGLVDHMGSDAAIVQAARVSYGQGTKTVNEDRGLIRYLFRHRHTSPIEMCQTKVHMKVPIVVMRQWVRHRTASLNEYSGRYSIMTDEFYLPAEDVLKAQSSDNKQGRAGELDEVTKRGVRWLMQTQQEQAYDCYRTLLGEKWHDQAYDPYDPTDPLLSDHFPGLARELARMVLPLSNYTEFYWSQNLHNMLHLLKLRLDSHAQYEIRAFAEALYRLIQPLYPLACEAFEDYCNQAVNVSRTEKELLKALLEATNDGEHELNALIAEAGSLKNFAEARGMSVRELREFAETWGLTLAG